ncbi:MAG TPA: IS256 family transposase [Saprospiraceae bacterium]|nr:IS256 family transposase [Lewinellaceae bacterium]HPK10149.1 IS256 family transposase [Saprospiraceae bacterium]HPQ22259.1 IS256 family transposase [Saprospiraceae bacterium]
MKEEQRKEMKETELYSQLREHLYSKKPLLGPDSPFSELLQGMVNTIIEGEMTAFLKEEQLAGRKNKRNGKNVKKVRSTAGDIYVETPRDRNADFEPELIGKRQRELVSGLDEQVLALYAQGNSIEDVKRLLTKMFGVELSAGKISEITDTVLPEIERWKNRELNSFYPIIYLDAIHFKVRQEGKYETNAFYTVYSVDWHGQRDLLGLYVQGSEGSSKWGLILSDLKKRGVKDVLVMCTDNLSGFSEVINESFPQAIVQKCIVHQVRNSMKYVDEKDRKKVASDLRKIYTSVSIQEAQASLESFGVKWGDKYAYIVEQWQSNWEELMAYMDFPVGMRKMIYTTNPVEALHRVMRKLIKSKAAWVSATALTKQLYLSLKHNEKSWKKQARGWAEIQRDILKLYPERVPK